MHLATFIGPMDLGIQNLFQFLKPLAKAASACSADPRDVGFRLRCILNSKPWLRALLNSLSASLPFKIFMILVLKIHRATPTCYLIGCIFNNFYPPPLIYQVDTVFIPQSIYHFNWGISLYFFLSFTLYHTYHRYWINLLLECIFIAIIFLVIICPR